MGIRSSKQQADITCPGKDKKLKRKKSKKETVATNGSTNIQEVSVQEKKEEAPIIMDGLTNGDEVDKPKPTEDQSQLDAIKEEDVIKESPPPSDAPQETPKEEEKAVETKPAEDSQVPPPLPAAAVPTPLAQEETPVASQTEPNSTETAAIKDETTVEVKSVPELKEEAKKAVELIASKTEPAPLKKEEPKVESPKKEEPVLEVKPEIVVEKIEEPVLEAAPAEEPSKPESPAEEPVKSSPYIIDPKKGVVIEPIKEVIIESLKEEEVNEELPAATKDDIKTIIEVREDNITIVEVNASPTVKIEELAPEVNGIESAKEEEPKISMDQIPIQVIEATPSPEEPKEIEIISKPVEGNDAGDKVEEVCKKVTMPVSFKWPSDAKKVAITGTFINWADPMPLLEEDGSWILKHNVEEGLHHHKYLVDGEWAIDQALPITNLEEHGQVNILDVKKIGDE